MLDNLTSRLASVVKTLRGQSRLSDDNIQDALREVRIALLEADVGLKVVKVDAVRNLLFVRGAIPGSKNGIVTVAKQGGPSRHD